MTATTAVTACRVYFTREAFWVLNVPTIVRNAISQIDRSVQSDLRIIRCLLEHHLNVAVKISATVHLMREDCASTNVHHWLQAKCIQLRELEQ